MSADADLAARAVRAGAAAALAEARGPLGVQAKSSPADLVSRADIASERAIVDLLREMRDRGKTVLVVHHDLHTAERYFDMLMMLNLRLVAFGNTEDVFTSELLDKTYGGRLTLLSEIAARAARETKS